MVAAINNTTKKTGLLPKYIVIILDDDLIQYLQYRGEDGVNTMLASWVKWLATEYDKLIADRLKQVPKKSGKVVPFFYWVSAPTHHFFAPEDNKLRIKFNLSLDSVIGSFPNMRTIKLKEVWNARDSNLVVNGRLTDQGITTFWCAVDASFKFNASRREMFLAKQASAHGDLSHSTQDRSGLKSGLSDMVGNKHVDPMKTFFKKYAECHMDT